MNEADLTWQTVTFLVGSVTAVSLVAIVVVWQVASAWRARTSAVREVAYRELAAEAAKAQERTSAALEELREEFRNLCTRTAELERLLKEVG